MEAEQKTYKKKTQQGIVVSNKMDKTVIVAITRQIKHRQYGKYISRTRKYVAHDATNECNVGDVVRIEESRPISKTKKWAVQAVLSKAVEV